jgi:hypothetical protein
LSSACFGFAVSVSTAIYERSVDRHGDSLIERHWKDSVFGFRLKERIVHLQKIHRAGRHQPHHRVVVLAVVPSDADVPCQPLIFPALKRFPVRYRIFRVAVHKVERGFARDLQQPPRLVGRRDRILAGKIGSQEYVP